MDNIKLTLNHIDYIDTLAGEIHHCLIDILNDKYSSQRARYDRLRIELSKVMLDVSKINKR